MDKCLKICSACEETSTLNVNLAQWSIKTHHLCCYYLRAIPYTWGLIIERVDKKAMLMSTLENPAADILEPVFLVRWQPSATVCCKGSKIPCTNFRNVPSAQQQQQKRTPFNSTMC